MTRMGALVLLTLLLHAPSLAASPPIQQEPQATAAEPARPRVTISQSVGPAGGMAAVPVLLADAEATRIGELKLTLRFASSKLTFIKVELGGLGASVGAEASATTRLERNDMVLEVTIATPRAGGDVTPLPDGPLAQLIFRVAKDLKPETVVPLKLEVARRGVAQGAKPITMAARDAEIIVSNPSVIGCFFYMH